MIKLIKDLAERDAIPANQRTIGMLVKDVSTGRYYQLLTGVTNADYGEVHPAAGMIRR